MPNRSALDEASSSRQFVAVDASRSWIDQAIEQLGAKQSIMVTWPDAPRAVIKARRDLFAARIEEDGLQIGVRSWRSSVHAWNLGPNEMIPAHQVTAAERGAPEITETKPFEPRRRTIFEIEERLLAALDERKLFLGLRSRNEAVKCALELYLNPCPVLTVETKCAGCQFGVDHCGVPGREFMTEIDRTWNAECPPGQQRTIRKVCVCEICK